MIYLGVSRKSGICGICKVRFGRGERVFLNQSKLPGNHLAHEKCWVDLRAKRQYFKPKDKPVIQSYEELDPPF